MLEDIEELAYERGMRNMAHADRQLIIATYAKKFVEYYTEIMEETLDE